MGKQTVREAVIELLFTKWMEQRPEKGYGCELVIYNHVLGRASRTNPMSGLKRFREIRKDGLLTSTYSDNVYRVKLSPRLELEFESRRLALVRQHCDIIDRAQGVA